MSLNLPQEPHFIGISCGNTHMNWSFHSGLAEEKYKPVLYWRTPHLNYDSFKSNDGDEASCLKTHLPDKVANYIFGEEEHPDGLAKAALRETEKHPKVKVFVVSVVKEKNEYIRRLLKPVPNELVFMNGYDFYSSEEGNYDTLGIDRVAALLGAQDALNGESALVFDHGTASTYLATDNDGQILGGGISPGLRKKFESMSDGCSALPRIDDDSVVSRVKDAIIKKEPLPTFAKDTTNAMIVSVLSEIASNHQRVIAQWLKKVGKENNGNIIFTGGNGELLSCLLNENANYILELNEEANVVNCNVLFDKHLIHHGIAAALYRKRFPTLKEKNQKEKSQNIKDYEQLIGERVAKYFDEPDSYGNVLYRGTISAIDRVKIKDKFTLLVQVTYDDGDKEEITLKEVIESIELFNEKGELGPEVRKSSIDRKRAAPNSSKGATSNKFSSKASPIPRKKSKSSTKKVFVKPINFKKPEFYIDKYVAKYFEKNIFYGIVKSYNREDGEIFWKIVYDDGDSEEFDAKDLHKGLVLNRKKSTSKETWFEDYDSDDSDSSIEKNDENNTQEVDQKNTSISETQVTSALADNHNDARETLEQSTSPKHDKTAGEVEGGNTESSTLSSSCANAQVGVSTEDGETVSKISTNEEEKVKNN